jgi:hypothetical protein
MTFGRPHAIPEDHIRLPLPVLLDEESLSRHTNGNVKATSVQFFVESV